MVDKILKLIFNAEKHRKRRPADDPMLSGDKGIPFSNPFDYFTLTRSSSGAYFDVHQALKWVSFLIVLLPKTQCEQGRICVSQVDSSKPLTLHSSIEIGFPPFKFGATLCHACQKYIFTALESKQKADTKLVILALAALDMDFPFQPLLLIMNEMPFQLFC